MRYLFLLLLLPSFAYGQVVGWVYCYHNAPGEKFGYIKVSLMDGNTERRSRSSQFDKLKPGANIIQFADLTGPARLTGMRLACEILTPPESGMTSEEHQGTVNWTKHLEVKTGVTAKPALVLVLEQKPDGWRAYIGNAP